MAKEIIPVIVIYSTSLEKWVGIRKFAELNGIDTSNIDAMIARIEKVGDVNIGQIIRFEISNYDGLYGSIFGTPNHPCPHCETHFECIECPLRDDSLGCCREWNKVKDQFR